MHCLAQRLNQAPAVGDCASVRPLKAKLLQLLPSGKLLELLKLAFSASYPHCCMSLLTNLSSVTADLGPSLSRVGYRQASLTHISLRRSVEPIKQSRSQLHVAAYVDSVSDGLPAQTTQTTPASKGANLSRQQKMKTYMQLTRIHNMIPSILLVMIGAWVGCCIAVTTRADALKQQTRFQAPTNHYSCNNRQPV